MAETKGRKISKAYNPNATVNATKIEEKANPGVEKLTAVAASASSAVSSVTKAQQDIALVAFDSIQSDNRSALKLPNSFVDQFQDADGIDTTSTTLRDASEYISTYGSTVVDYNPFAEETWAGSYNVSSDNTLGYTVNGSARAFQSTASGSGYAYTTTTRTADGVYEFELEIQQRGGGGGPGLYFQVNKNGGTASANYNGTTTTGRGVYGNLSGRSAGDRVYIKWDGTNGGVNEDIITSSEDFDRDGVYTNQTTSVNLSGSAWSTTNASTVGWFFSAWKDANPDWIVALKYGRRTENGIVSTGNFTGITQASAASVSKVSVVIMYEDNVGTTALNTDLVAQVSADAGSNYSTVTLTAAPNLTSTIKVAKSDAVAVTAGTQPKYKINFANQDTSTKVTRVLGVALLY